MKLHQILSNNYEIPETARAEHDGTIGYERCLHFTCTSCRTNHNIRVESVH